MKSTALLLTLLTALLAATTAQAATYTVHSCKTPSGRWVGAEGWSADLPEPIQNREVGQVESCNSQSSSLAIRFGQDRLPAEPRTGRRLRFEAPPQTAISSIWASRSFELGWPVVPEVYGRPYVYDAWHDQDEVDNRLEIHNPPWDSSLISSSLALDARAGDSRWGSVTFRLRCWELMGEALCGPLAVRLVIARATLELQDGHPPTGQALTGEFSATPIRGTGQIRFTASDLGGGVYRAIVAVDGGEVSRSVVDGNGGACGDVEDGNTDAYEFAVPRPCPLDVDGEVSFDTRGLRDGNHAVTLSVEDAAGNTTVIEDEQVTTHNAPIAQQAPRIGGEARVGGTLTVTDGQWDGSPTGYDRRWLRCDAAGEQCLAIPGAAGAAYVPTATDAYGTLVAEVVAGNGSGTATARTSPSAPVADANGRTSPAVTPPASGDGGPRAAAPTPDVPTTPNAQNPRHEAGVEGRPQNPVTAPASGGPLRNGENASAQAKLTVGLRRADGGTAARVRSKRARSWVVAGRLVDEHGRAIGGARVNAHTRVLGRGWKGRDALRTDTDGRFAYALPAGPSRDVRFTYLPFADGSGARASNTVTVHVFSPLTIGVDRRRVTGRGVVTIRGRAGGELIPSSGLLVTLQGYQRGWGWRTFRTVRTSRTGTWKARYRFRSPAGRFAFRAIVPRQGSYPFMTTTSPSVAVTVA